MGVLGLAALLAVVLTAIWLAGRTSLRRLPAASFALGVTIALLVCAMELAALGLVPGVPATALLWLAVGAAIALPRGEVRRGGS